MRREYKTGTKWCVWRWKELSFGDRPYLDRLHLLHTPYGGVMLHWFSGPDPQRDPHDHPVTFWSFVLRGWYVEERFSSPSQCSLRLVTGINKVKAPEIHRIIRIAKGTTTLVFYGPSTRQWGFHTPEGWEHWQAYNKRHGW